MKWEQIDDGFCGQGYPTASERVGRGSMPKVVDRAGYDRDTMWLILRHNERRGGNNYIGETPQYSIVFVALEENDPVPDDVHRVCVRLEAMHTRGGFKADKAGRPMYIGTPVRDNTEVRKMWFRDGDDLFVQREVTLDWASRIISVAEEVLGSRAKTAVVRLDSIAATVEWVDWRERIAHVTLRQECVSTTLKPYNDNSGAYWIANSGSPHVFQSSADVDIIDLTLEGHQWPFVDLYPMNQKKDTVRLVVWFNYDNQTITAPTEVSWRDLGKWAWNVLSANYPLCPACREERRYKDWQHCSQCSPR